ncbi:MAG: LacI family DNA-binding transcriptional regulator [bacterium]
MALKRVTMQDIADACGLSRNTVSKIFNGRGNVSEATRKAVLTKAAELGYNQLIREAAGEGGSIALFTQHKLFSHNFGAFFITSFTDQICRAGYTIQMYEVSDEEIAARRLPPHLTLEETAGILLIELFDRDYLDMVVSLGLPVLTVDGFAHIGETVKKCDFISMENTAAVFALIDRLLRGGARSVGFVGDTQHCNSFYERWIGFRVALERGGLTIDRSQCILEKDSDLYGDVDWLTAKLDAMPRLPEAFVCANDFLAVRLMAALKRRGLAIPGDIMVTGFDGSVESAMVEPPLTTAQIPGSDIGKIAAAMLIERIQDPERTFRSTYITSTPLFRASTR